MKTKGKREPSKITTDGSKTTLKESAKTGICIAERMQNPANYRGITVTKIFTKIIQSILKSRVDIQIDQIQNPLQRGFTEAIPMLFAAFIASEVIIESSTNNDELLLLILDAEKAFHKLNHEILFNKLCHNGIKGDM